MALGLPVCLIAARWRPNGGVGADRLDTKSSPCFSLKVKSLPIISILASNNTTFKNKLRLSAFSLDINFSLCSYSGIHVRRDPDGSIPSKHDKGPVHA